MQSFGGLDVSSADKAAQRILRLNVRFPLSVSLIRTEKRDVTLGETIPRILVTGASGRIGQAFFAAFQEQYDFVLTDLNDPEYPVSGPHRFVQSDLTDANASGTLCQGTDAVVHLAGVPDPDAPFADVLPANILATTYLIEAARKASVSRFVYASSAQTIEGSPVDRQIV